MNHLDKKTELLIEEYKERITAAYAYTEQLIQSQPKLNKRDAIFIVPSIG